MDFALLLKRLSKPCDALNFRFQLQTEFFNIDINKLFELAL